MRGTQLTIAGILVVMVVMLTILFGLPQVKRFENFKNSHDNRAGFVLGVLEAAFNDHDGQYNVMVFNLAQKYNSDGLIGTKVFDRKTLGDLTYGVWVFKYGVFINEGDGGPINWAFRGSFERSGEQGRLVVTFSAIPAHDL